MHRVIQVSFFLALEGLLEDVKLLIELGELLTFAPDFADGMQDGCVVTTAEQFSDLGQAFLGQFFGQVHRNLTGPGNRGGPFLGIHVSHFDLVIVGDGFLDIFNRYLAVLDG